MLFVPWVRFTQDNYTPVCICRLYVSLEKCDTLVIPHQDQGTSYRSQHICEVTLEETFHPFVPSNLLPAVPGSLVHLLLLSTHHHKSPPNGVKGVCHCDRPSCNCLCYGKSDENAGFVSSKLLCSIIGTKIYGSVQHEVLARLGLHRVAHSLDTASQAVEHGPYIASALHGDDPELILLVDPGQEGLVLVVEDAASLRPVP